MWASDDNFITFLITRRFLQYVLLPLSVVIFLKTLKQRQNMQQIVNIKREKFKWPVFLR